MIRGRTMEFGFPLSSNVIVVPSGTAMTGTLPDGKHGIAYTTKYSMVGANAVGQTVILDGLNDQGLSFGLFYFPGFAEYPAVSAANSGKAMAPFEFGAWVLGNFASVDEVKAALARRRGRGGRYAGARLRLEPVALFPARQIGQVDRRRAARRHPESVRRPARRGDQCARLRLASHQLAQLPQSQRDQRAAARSRRHQAHPARRGRRHARPARRLHPALALHPRRGLHPIRAALGDRSRRRAHRLPYS